MTDTRSVEVDFESWKLVQLERRSFDEPEYLAVRRLFKLPEPPPALDVGTAAVNVGSGVPWVQDGVEVPHGSLARMRYGRGAQVHEGRFLNGKLVVNGKAFQSLSAAAGAVALTADGSHPSLNGWLYWELQFPGETMWRPLSQLRKRNGAR